MKITIDEVEYVIDALNTNLSTKFGHDSFNYFMTGHCYIFGKILKSIFNEGHILDNGTHVVFIIDENLYDTRYNITLKDLENWGGPDLRSSEDDEGFCFCEICFTPDDKIEANEVMEFLIPVGKKARDNYEKEHQIGGKQKIKK